jgi:hypothetical protein
MGLLTIGDLKLELNIADTDTEYDVLIATILDAVQSLFDEMTHRTSEKTTHTEYHSSEDNDTKIFLENWPVVSITSLYDDPDWEYNADDLINPIDYTMNLSRGVIKYNSYFQQGFNNIKVVYIAGYDATNLPASWKQIWVRQAAYWFKEAKNKLHGQASVTIPGGGMSVTSLTDNLLDDFTMLVELEKR